MGAPGVPTKRKEMHEKSEEGNTTLMLRNLPNDYNREMFLEMLDWHGFRGAYNLAYFPIDFSTGAGVGYAFVNLQSPADVPRFWEMFDGHAPHRPRSVET